MTREQRLVVAFALAAFTMLPIAAFILLRDGGGDDSKGPATVARGCSDADRAADVRLGALPSPTPLGPNLDIEQMNRDSRAASEPRFLAKVCGVEFVATEEEARLPAYCEPGEFRSLGGPAAFVASELNKPDMTEQSLCKDGTAYAVFSGTGRKAYFRDTPRVAFATNRDHIRTLEIDGKPGIIVVPGFQIGPHFYAIVQRWPEGDKPGILLIGGAFTSGYNDAVAQARKSLSE